LRLACIRQEGSLRTEVEQPRVTNSNPALLLFNLGKSGEDRYRRNQHTRRRRLSVGVTCRRVRVPTKQYPRHQWKLARETVTLDHLTGGRVVLGVGLGDDFFGEIRTFDGPVDLRTRAVMLDEGLAVLLGLWSAEKFSFAGKPTRSKRRNFSRRLCKSRGPIWVAG
jgi:alkanesulfonate monooxygenase SsuD/methylene tetrahydromethanopterin reductase-like flavin-dependent oxidoreductase (luciferase family)